MPVLPLPPPDPAAPVSFLQLMSRAMRDFEAAYRDSPFAPLSRDCWARYRYDAAARPQAEEIAIGPDWRLLAPAGPVPQLLCRDVEDFLRRVMHVAVRREEEGIADKNPTLRLQHDANAPAGGFFIEAAENGITVGARDDAGLRDGAVKLIEIMGLRQAPFIRRGRVDYRPLLDWRVGTIPLLGSLREAVMLGCNGVFLSGQSLFGSADNEVLPHLEDRRQPGALEVVRREVAAAREYALRTVLQLTNLDKFPGDHPLFSAHPEIRGARVWSEAGGFVLCTEHPLVQEFIGGVVFNLFRAVPDLDAISLIIGGEGFDHCYMRPFGVPPGQTSCPRCAPLGAEQVVANLCNLLARAARRANPRAEVVVWPYSAAHVWSCDAGQLALMGLLEPGVSLLTEIEKDEVITTPAGIEKQVWDYSIHLPEPGKRACAQMATGRRHGVPVYLKSEPELSFEVSCLSHLPVLDLWWRRAQSVAHSQAGGAWVFPYFRVNYNNSPGELWNHAWWDPQPGGEEVLRLLAARIAGREGGPYLRRAWQLASEALLLSPALPPYFQGPEYLGPAHPMLVNLQAEVPPIFYGQYYFYGEGVPEEALKLRPTFITEPRRQEEVVLHSYHKMRDLLSDAVAELDKVPAKTAQDMVFRAETVPLRWFYHTMRTVYNFHLSCWYRDGQAEDSAANATTWHEVLADELENARTALPLAEEDIRFDFYHGVDHRFAHTADMVRAKIELLLGEIEELKSG